MLLYEHKFYDNILICTRFLCFKLMPDCLPVAVQCDNIITTALNPVVWSGYYLRNNELYMKIDYFNVFRPLSM